MTDVIVAVTDEAPRGHRRHVDASGFDRRTVILAVLLALATVAAAVLALAPRRQAPPAGPPSPVQASTWPGLELDPSFSPDGSAMAFAADRAGAFELFIQPFTPGSVATQITSEGRQCFQPSWSPDGATIAFFTASEGGGIWLVPSAGGRCRRLTDFGSHPAWSPDGALIAFQSDARAQLAANSNDALPPSTLWLADPADGSVRALTRAGQPTGGHGAPSWSPDGERLFFSSSDRRRSQIWAIELATGELTEVVADPAICLQPTCAPDGQSLYFSAVTSGERYGVWRVPIAKNGRATGPPVIVLNLGSAIIRHLALDATGQRMVYSALATASNLWSLPLDPAAPAPLGPPTALTTGTGRNNRPAFSPDGSAIAFDRWHVGVNRSLWVMAANGSELRQVTRDDDTNTHASWFPDGQRLAFLSNSGDGWGVWQVDLAGAAKARLATLPDDAAFATLSPDGSQVAYHTGNGGAVVNLWVAATDGSGARQLSFESAPVGFPIWSPDSSQLAFELMRGDDSYLALMAAAGGEITTLVADDGDSWPFSFSPDGKWIAFAGKRDEYWNLYAVATTGEVRQLTADRRLNAYLRYPAWAPRGDRLVYELAETTGDVWLLDRLP